MFVLLLLMSFLNVFACDLSNSIRHVNPDGSLGGWVEKTARVASTAHVGTHAKVCSESRVDGNAIIEGKAIVSGKSWVSGNVKIVDESAVYGNAQIVSSGEEIVISGKSKVFGHSRIRGISRITGSSQVSGGMDLENILTSGQAKLCLNYHLKDRIINDDFHCLKTSETEVALSLQNYSENKINIKSKDVVFKLKDSAFSIQPSAVKVILNQTMLSSQVVVRRGLISFPSDVLVAGKNTILIVGQDYNRKKIVSKEFQVYVSENKTLIDLGVDNEFDDALVKIMYYQEDEEFEAVGKVINGVLEIDSPNHNDFTHVRILAASSNFVLYKEIGLDSVTEFPENLELIPLSSKSNGSPEFSESMSGWSVSDSSRVIYKNDEKRSIALVSSNESDLLISKVLTLPKHAKQLAYNISPLSPIKGGAINSKLESLIIPLNKKEFEKFDINPRSKDISDDYISEAFKETINTENFIALFVLDKASNETSNEELEIYSITSGRYIYQRLQFFPYNFGVTNLETHNFERQLSTYNIFDVDCGEGVFGINGIRDKFVIERQPLRYISRNYNANVSGNAMGFIKKNRIWGDLYLGGIPYLGYLPEILFFLRDPETLLPVAISRVSTCVSKKVAISSMTHLADYGFRENLVAPLMEFDLSNGKESFSANEKLILEAVVPQYGDFPGTTLSWTLPVLVPLLIGEKYYNKEKVDHYDRSAKGYTRTGGDKWIRPGYQDVFESSLTKEYADIWQVNDLSMLNGGNFGHETHEQGIDGDYSYGTYDFTKFSTAAEWMDSLKKIEDFASKIDYTYLNDIAIEYRNSKYSPHFIVSRFQNRCMKSCRSENDCDSRFINLDKGKGKRSLFRDVDGHANHLHVRFNDPILQPEEGEADQRGTPQKNILRRDLDDNFISKLKFSLDITSSGEWFSVLTRPDTGQAFAGKTVYWRYQDVWGFSDFNMKLCAGDSSTLVYDQASMIKCGTPMSNTNLRYIYLMLVDDNTGECIVAKDGSNDFIEIDISNQESLKRIGVQINRK